MVLKNMTMFTSTCRWNYNSDDQIAIIITTGFIGQLQEWWDHYLSEEQKNQITFAKNLNLKVLLQVVLNQIGLIP